MERQVADLTRFLENLHQNVFPPHIDELPVKDKYKRAFALIEQYGITQPWGLFLSTPKDVREILKHSDYKTRSAFHRTLYCNYWGLLTTILLGPVYYLLTGMWRKGLALYCSLIIIDAGINALFVHFAGEKISPMPIAIACGIIVLFISTYDLYRLHVKQEIFWW